MLESAQNFNSVLNGFNGNNPYHSLVFLTPDSLLDLNKSKNLSIGIFDYLGRPRTEKFVRQYISSLKKIQRVTKIEDLLSLLYLNMADGILVSDIHVPYLKDRSKLRLKEIKLPGVNLNIISMMTKKGKLAPHTKKALREMPKETMKILGISKWK